MRLEVSLRATNLKNVAGFGVTKAGTSDPFAVITQIATEPGKSPTVLGKTEVLSNNLSPNWAKNFALDYDLGTPCKLAVTVFHKKKSGSSESMGSALFDVGQTLGARGSTKAKQLKGSGKIYMTVRKSEGTGVFRFKFRGEKLKNVEGMFRKSDPFFEIFRNVNNAGANTWELVHRSEVVMDNLNPAWKVQSVELSLLCGGNLDLPLRFKVYDHESSGKHVDMGSFETTVNQLVQAYVGNDRSIGLRSSGKPVGSLILEQAEVALPADRSSNAPVPASTVTYEPKPSFVDYVNGGCELNVVVAIDFTGSNGNPREPGTLHYLDPSGALNDYQKAICAILRILAKYDHDQKFPVFGFGAKYDGQVRHCFQCGPDAEAKGVSGVLDAYRAVFSSGLIMSKPTDFTQVIDVATKRSTAMQEQAQAEGRQAYTILLILSDGAVADKHATMDALHRAKDAPLSIVIVGVGNEDFSDMHFLDDAPAQFGRDMVQFVQFNKYSQNSSALSSQTLREIPDQLVSFFQARGIGPLPPLQVEEEEIAVDAEEEEIDLRLNVDEDEIVVAGGGFSVQNAFVP